MFRKSSISSDEYHDDRNRFEHWLRENTIYFITARCHAKFPAFTSSAATSIFWDRYDHWTARRAYVPIVRTLMNNHYHSLG